MNGFSESRSAIKGLLLPEVEPLADCSPVPRITGHKTNRLIIMAQSVATFPFNTLLHLLHKKRPKTVSSAEALCMLQNRVSCMLSLALLILNDSICI